MRDKTISFDGSPVRVSYLTKIENAEFNNGVRQELPPTLFIATKDQKWFDSLEVGSEHTIEYAGTEYPARLIDKLPDEEFDVLELHFATKFL
ncbi:MAG: hypothetical protein ACERJ1_08725 [Halodesulfovibrio sp.]|uniref:hypothetical protein n=1 Tax=Halodesulfovibrio sp. TaxID=1912772 RepID=UPI00359E98F1